MTDLRYINFFWICAVLAPLEAGMAAYAVRIGHPTAVVHCAFVLILCYLATHAWSHRHDD